MLTQDNLTGDLNIYACPTCKSPLKLINGTLSCPNDRVTYPIHDSIPDFILEDLTRSSIPLLRWANSNYDRQAGFYERSRYPFRLMLYAGFRSPSLKDLVHEIAEIVDMDEGLILDVACGPGTLGRRIASSSTAVYGIDISLGMLRQGVAYVRRDHIANVHFARAKAEGLPFQDARFDAAVCGAALHLFADPLMVLRELGRAVKPGAPLAVTTMTDDHKGIFRFRRIREEARRRGSHLFKVQELEQFVVKAGFDNFRPQMYGSMVLFGARKRM